MLRFGDVIHCASVLSTVSGSEALSAPVAEHYVCFSLAGGVAGHELGRDGRIRPASEVEGETLGRRSARGRHKPINGYI